jgi:hypothetical protein
VSEGAELYQIKFWNMFVTLENLDNDSDINRACIMLRDIINYGFTKDVDNC